MCCCIFVLCCLLCVGVWVFRVRALGWLVCIEVLSVVFCLVGDRRRLLRCLAGFLFHYLLVCVFLLFLLLLRLPCVTT